MLKLRGLTLFSVIVLMVLLSACSGNTATATAPTSSGSETIVNMKNLKFVPANITIKAGTTVKWVNQDSFAHTVVSGTRDNPTTMFDSGDVQAGQTFSFKFTTPGVYPYYCTPHQGMDGQVTVE
jgi:plastocyanin